MAEILSEKVRCSSKMKPRLRAERVVLSEELCTLSSCFLSPMSKNSVLEELRVRRFAANRNWLGRESHWYGICNNLDQRQQFQELTRRA